MMRPLQTQIGEQDPTAISVLKTLEALSVIVRVARISELRPLTWDLPRFVSTHWRLYQHDSVGGELILDQGAVPIVPSRIYLIPPRLAFGTRCVSPCIQYFVHFELAGFPAVALHDVFPSALMVPESPPFEGAVREWFQHSSADDDAASVRGLSQNYRVKGIIYEALGRAVESLPEDRLRDYVHRLSALQPILPAIEQIRGHLSEKLSNPSLAALCFMSKDYFVRKFHAALGVSPAQYIVERRVAAAAQRLLFTSDSLEEIAEQTGFRNRFYFTRVFSREMGVPPAAYRRMPQP